MARVTEARTVEGERPYREVMDAVQAALTERYGSDDSWVWVRDLNDSWVVYELEEPGVEVACYRIDYTIDDAGTVTLAEIPAKVEIHTEYVTVTEATGKRVKAKRPVTTDYLGSRIVESKGTDPDGGRVFGMQLIEVGISKNGVKYTAPVLAQAARLYEGVKAFDHHRTTAELATSSITGMCGYWRHVEAAPDGLYGDLHLLPSATHVAESLDASLVAQNAGLAPVIGVSHDVMVGGWKHVVEGGRRAREATSIEHVSSVDVVADPSAGGRVTRVVAGGIGTEPDEPEEKAMTLKELLDLLRAAAAEDRAALLTEHAAILEAAGFTADDVPTLLGESTTTETPKDEAAKAEPETEEKPELVTVGAPADEDTVARESTLGRMVVREAVKAAGLPDGFVGHVTGQLPERFTEAHVTAVVGTVKATASLVEKTTLEPKVPHVRITEADADKKRAKLEASFNRDWQNGYTSITEAYFDITGLNASRMFDRSQDIAAEIVLESWGGPMLGGRRVAESVVTTTWGEVLADVMGKRMARVYSMPNLLKWRPLVDIVPVSNFRSQKVIRWGGYGTLPTVNEGAPYQPLTTPGDEQVTYTPSKKGGTEDWTYETVRNDDLKQLVNIPDKLARAAARTVHDAIFGIYTTNAAVSYDSVALFHATHANTASGTVLNEAGLDTLRQKMRDQAAYGDSTEILGLTPKFLLVPNELENTANKLAGAVALPSSGYASDQPNLHAGITPIVIDIWTDANDYIVQADPMDCPGIEIGFLDGKEQPDLFVQDDPTVGSVFSADKVTWKVRHIYGYTAVDHRAFQRMTN